MDRVVLADAGPLIHLAQIQNGLSWLERMFERVAITSVVRAEVLPGRNAPGEEEIAEALRLGILYEINEIPLAVQLPRAGRGEALTIRVALTLTEKDSSCLLIMDDRKGRKVVEGLRSASIGRRNRDRWPCQTNGVDRFSGARVQATSRKWTLRLARTSRSAPRKSRRSQRD